MDSAPNNRYDTQASGTGEGRGKRRNRKKRGNPNASHAGDSAVAAPQQTSTGNAASNQAHMSSQSSQPQQPLAPSVQKLFDSISNPVNLQITVTGKGRQVNEASFYPAEPTPLTSQPPPKQHQHKPVHHSGQGSYSSEGTAEQPGWPTLEDSVMGAGKQRDVELRLGPKMKTPKKNKRRKKGKGEANKPPNGDAVHEDTPDMTNDLSKQLGEMTMSKELSDHSASSSTDKTNAQAANSQKTAPSTAAPVQNSSKQKNGAINQPVQHPEKVTTDPPPAASQRDNNETEDSGVETELSTPNCKAESNTEVAKMADKSMRKAEQNRRSPPPQNVFTRYLDSYRSKVGTKYIKELDKDFIRPLSKKSQKYPNAYFYCRLCEYHMDTPEDMEEHRIGEDAHLRRKRIKSGDELLKNLPTPTQSHMKALSQFLDEIYEDVVLSDEDVAARKSAVDKMEKDLHEHSSTLQSVRLQICGSVKAGFALKSSDTNIRIITPKTANLALVMTDIHAALLALEPTYKDVQKQFTVREPYISLSIEGVGGVFRMQFLDESYYICNMLLSCYSRWHPKLKKLSILLKYLAKVGKISDAASGALAAYCFPLLSIFYCQRYDLAPVFFEGVDMESKTEVEFQGDIDGLDPVAQYYSDYIECKSIGELWLNLFNYYSLIFKHEIHCVAITSRRPVAKTSKAWGSKRLAIEDPALPKRNLSKTVSHQRVFDFISDVIRKSYKYFGIPQLESGPAFTRLLVPDPKSPSQNGTPAKGNVELVDVVEVGSQSRSVPVEDDVAEELVDDTSPPYSTPTEVDEVETPTQDAIQASGDSPLAELADPLTLKELASSHLPNTKQGGDSTQSVDSEQNDDNSVEPIANSSLNSDEGIPVSTSDNAQSNADTTQTEAATSSADAVVVKVEQGILYDSKGVEKLTVEEICFDFLSKHLGISEQELPIFCRQCSKPNHIMEDCPDEQLPPCVPLPPPSKEHRATLSRLLEEIKEQNELCAEHKEIRQRFVEELTFCIQSLYPETELNLYGSSCNGFGSVGSDLDICMTLYDTESLDPADTRYIIKRVAQRLNQVEHLVDIIPLIHAKVPIIKFGSMKFELEADISLYNILAQRNTQMLHRYSEIDERVRPLGYCAKEFAKNCDIGDASKGSLSSYAYVLMLIYYLQQCDPPVLPVLQELYDGETSPEVIVEGWNTWFFNGDNKQLAEVWPGYGKNDLDVAQLWIGFLDFYAQKFEYKSCVASIRQFRKMSKFEKLWNSDTLAIEDPFDLKRNLGVALSKKMNAYILSTFIKARAVFYTSPEILQEMPVEERPSIYKFYFHHKELPTGGGERAPEHSRTCRRCGKIGHFARLCPVKSQRNDRQNQLREMRQQANRKDEHRNREMERRSLENDSHGNIPADRLRYNTSKGSPRKPQHQRHYRGSPNKQVYDNMNMGPPHHRDGHRMPQRQHNDQQHMMHHVQNRGNPQGARMMIRSNNVQRQLGFVPMGPGGYGQPPLHVAAAQQMMAATMTFNNSSMQHPQTHPVPNHPFLPHR